MIKQIIFAYPENENIAKQIAKNGDEIGKCTFRHFPDSESYVRIESDIIGREILLVCSLNQPDKKAMAIMFFAKLAKELGATKVGLIAPYLGYMRQDKRFNQGEAITSIIFAKFISQHFDWLITVDPHLHRHKTLDKIYQVPTKVVHAAPYIARWIKDNIEKPLLIGPDKESKQWVKDVAKRVDAPFTVLVKTRHGDKNVSVSMPDIDKYKNHTPVLIDDIISTARTMIETILHLKSLNTKPPICIGVHAIFADNAYAELKACGVENIVTCNTITHPSNGINVSDAYKMEF